MRRGPNNVFHLTSVRLSQSDSGAPVFVVRSRRVGDAEASSRRAFLRALSLQYDDVCSASLHRVIHYSAALKAMSWR